MRQENAFERRSVIEFNQRRSIMKRTTKIALAVGTALTLGLAGAAVNAQPYGYGPGYGMGYGQGYGPGAHMGWGGGPMGYGMGRHAFANANPTALAEGRLAYLKSELKITPAQESKWQAFATQTKQSAEAMQSMYSTMHNSSVTSAPELLALRNEVMKKRLEQSEKTAAALKDLYASLTPDQKAILDQGPNAFGPGRGPGGRFR